MVSTAEAKCQAMKASPASSPKVSSQVPVLPRAAASFSGMGAKNAFCAASLYGVRHYFLCILGRIDRMPGGHEVQAACVGK